MPDNIDEMMLKYTPDGSGLMHVMPLAREKWTRRASRLGNSWQTPPQDQEPCRGSSIDINLKRTAII